MPNLPPGMMIDPDDYSDNPRLVPILGYTGSTSTPTYSTPRVDYTQPGYEPGDELTPELPSPVRPAPVVTSPVDREVAQIVARDAEIRARQATAPSVGTTNPIVVGVSQSTNEVLVKDSSGRMYYKPATPEQLKEATQALKDGGEYNKKYVPPAGGTSEKPVPGTLAAPATEKEVRIFDYRGKVITTTPEAITQITNSMGKEQFNLSVKMGLIPSNATFIDEGGGNWAFNVPIKEQKVIFDTLQNVNKMGETEFNKLVSDGTIKKGSVYAGVGPDGNIRYYPPGTVVKVGNGEVMSKEDYANLPREWKGAVDSKGLTGLGNLATKGDLPMLPDEWWYQGKVIAGEEKERIIWEWKAKRETTNILSNEYTRLGNNPELEMTRAVSPDDLGRALSTFNQNAQTKLRNSVEIWNTLADQMPSHAGGQIARITLQELNKAVRTAGSAGLVLAEAFTVAAPLAITQALSNPSKVPGMIGNIVVNTGRNFTTLGQAMIGDKTITPETVGTAGAGAYLTFIAVKGAVSKVATYLAPKGLPVKLIGKEYSTGRVPMKDIDPVAMTKAMNQVEKLAASKGGASSGSVPIEGTPYSLNYLKTPYQQRVGDTLWHGTGDMDFTKGATLTAKELGTGGEPGLYTNPWAAAAYAKGANPGLVMVITKASNIKSPSASATAQLPTQSDFFIEQASKGLYGSSKTWRGDLETEVVAAPGTEFIIPKANADLMTRFTVGKSADFFTYANGQFMPIKMAIDKGLLKSGDVPYIPTATDLYAVKLHSLQNSLQNFTEAVKHPARTLGDIFKGTPEPGVREVYLTKNGQAVGDIAQSLTTDALGRAFREAETRGIDARSGAFQTLFNRELDDTYREKAESLVQQYTRESDAYQQDTNRAKFEEIYRVNLEDTMRSLVESAAVRASTAREVEQMLGRQTVRDRQTARVIEPVRTDRPTIREDSSVPTTRIEEGRIQPPRVKTPDRIEPPEFIRPPDIRPPDEIRPPDRINPPDRIKPPEQKPRQEGKGLKPAQDEPIPTYTPEDGAVTFKMGARPKGPVFHTLSRPYKTKRDLRTTVGEVPKGAVLARGKGSAQKTATLLKGQGPDNVNMDVGMMDVNLKSHGKRVELKFTADPKGLTRYPIHVGNPRRPSQKLMKPRNQSAPSQSIKRGRQFFTPIGNSVAVSRRPLKNRRR